MSNDQGFAGEKSENKSSKNECENEHFSGEIYSLQEAIENTNDLQFIAACEFFFQKVIPDPYEELNTATQFAILESNYRLPLTAALIQIYQDIGYSLEYFKFLEFPFEIVDMYPNLSKAQKLSLLQDNLQKLKLDMSTGLTTRIFENKISFIQIGNRFINVEELGYRNGMHFYKEKGYDNYFISHHGGHLETTESISKEEYLSLIKS